MFPQSSADSGRHRQKGSATGYCRTSLREVRRRRSAEKSFINARLSAASAGNAAPAKSLMHLEAQGCLRYSVLCSAWIGIQPCAAALKRRAQSPSRTSRKGSPGGALPAASTPVGLFFEKYRILMLPHDAVFMTFTLHLVAGIISLTRGAVARACTIRVLNRKLLSLVGDRAVRPGLCERQSEFRGRPVARLRDVVCSPHGVVPFDRPDRHNLKWILRFRSRPDAGDGAAAAARTGCRLRFRGLSKAPVPLRASII